MSDNTKLYDGFQNPGKGITVCIPTLGRPVNLDWADSYKSMTPPINFNMHVRRIVDKPIAEARNAAVESALAAGHRYLFFLSDDVIIPPQTLKQLIYRMEQNKNIGVCGGVYCSKSEPAAPLVFKENGSGSYWDWKIGEFFEVTGLGMDCTIIRLSMCAEMAKKDPVWFKTIDADQFVDGHNKAESWTEDLYFLNRVKEETDYKIYCEGSLICDHWDYNTGKYFNLPSDSYPVVGHKEPLAKNKLKKAIDLGCGTQQRSWKGYSILRYDINEDVNPDYRGDVRQTPFGNSQFDLVFSSHVLEHINRGDSGDVLNEWKRILKNNGIFIVVVPDLGFAVNRIKAGILNRDVLNVLYGGQTNEWDFHQNGFTNFSLANVLENILEFKHVHIAELLPYNLVGIASNKKFNYEKVLKLILEKD